MNRFHQRSTALIAVTYLFAICSPGMAQFGGAGGRDVDKPEAETSTKAAPPEKSTTAEAKQDAKKAELCYCIGDTNADARKKINQALNSPLHPNGLDFVETPLKDVMTQLQEDYAIPIQIDVAALEENGMNLDSQVTVNIHNVSLQSALRLMLKHLNLTTIYQDECLMITTNDAAEKRTELCVYDVHDVVGDDANELRELTTTITDCVATDTWSENGGGTANIRIVRPALLVISQSQATHDEIRRLLTAIRAAHAESGNKQPTAASAPKNETAGIATRSYILQLNPTNDVKSMQSQVRELITRAFPRENWNGELIEGEGAALAIFPDRIVIRQTPAVQEKVQKLLQESGVATPATNANESGGMMGGFGPGGLGGPGGFGGGSFFGAPGSQPAPANDSSAPGRPVGSP